MRRAGHAAAVLLVAACAPVRRPPAAVPAAELRLATDPARVLDAARVLMESDSTPTLVTVDAAGRPRARTVRAFLVPRDSTNPARGFTVFVATRAGTRKVAQVRGRGEATLHFADDRTNRYLSLMGSARLHTDPEAPGLAAFRDSTLRRYYWPAFPADFAVLEVRPAWLEYVGRGVRADSVTWQPQAVVLPATP